MKCYIGRAALKCVSRQETYTLFSCFPYLPGPEDGYSQ